MFFGLAAVMASSAGFWHFGFCLSGVRGVYVGGSVLEQLSHVVILFLLGFYGPAALQSSPQWAAALGSARMLRACVLRVWSVIFLPKGHILCVFIR